MKENIPKIIHYCWFGKGEKPAIVTKCINSWKVHLPDYQFIEWNEDNFDLHSHTYVSEAYQARKFAFVSDYVRAYALYHYGGIYLDTDVEVFKKFDDLLDHESFWGFEQENYIATSTIGAKKGNKLIELFLDSYQNKTFFNEDGSLNEVTNVAIISQILEKKSLKLNGEYQNLAGNAFYPQTYFSPYDYINCRKFFSKDTYAIHHFYKSWLPLKARMKAKMKQLAARLIGGNNLARLRKIL